MAQLARNSRMSFDDAIGLQHGAADPRLIDAMVAARRKSAGQAYRLWYFAGLFGVQISYPGKPVLRGLQACRLPFCVVVFQIAGPRSSDRAGGRAVGILG